MTQNHDDSPVTGSPASMSRSERRSAIALAAIFTLRMLGLFMILPVFTLHAPGYAGYTPTLAGLAIGIYGLTQAVFQIPFGMLSDRIGRKPVIMMGLVVFAAGSAVAALADSILGVVAGRALQGLGAIAAAVMALTADLTREESRTRAMGVIGASIGLSFAVALVAGPAVTRWVGLSGLFWFTGALALGGIAVLYLLVPSPVSTRFHRDAEAVPAQFARILGDGQLLRLDFGILILHLVMTAIFVVLPVILRDRAGLDPARHWQLYLGVLVASLVVMVPFVIYADRRQRLKQVFVGAVLVLALSQLGLYARSDGLAPIAVLMVAFFGAFNILEASLPSLVSRMAPVEMKGTALGAYSTSQYLGAFIGGVLGGWLYGNLGAELVFACCGALCIVWFALAAGMRSPKPLATRMLRLGAIDEAAAAAATRRLAAVPGVAEAVVIVEDGIAYLKVNPRELDEGALRAISLPGA